MLSAFLTQRCPSSSTFQVGAASNTIVPAALPAEPVAAASIERVVPNTARRRQQHRRRCRYFPEVATESNSPHYSHVSPLSTLRTLTHSENYSNSRDREYEYDLEYDENVDGRYNTSHDPNDHNSQVRNNDTEEEDREGNRMLSNFGILRRRLTSGRYDGLTASQVSLAAVRIVPSSPMSRRTSSSVVLCTICLDEVGESDQARKLAVCGHEFHATCIGNWLRRVNKCPNCQRTALLGADGKRARLEAAAGHRRSTRSRWLPGRFRNRHGQDSNPNRSDNDDDVARLKRIPESLRKVECSSHERSGAALGGRSGRTEAFSGVGASGPTPLSPLDDDLVDHLLGVMQR